MWGLRGPWTLDWFTSERFPKLLRSINLQQSQINWRYGVRKWSSVWDLLLLSSQNSRKSSNSWPRHRPPAWKKCGRNQCCNWSVFFGIVSFPIGLERIRDKRSLPRQCCPRLKLKGGNDRLSSFLGLMILTNHINVISLGQAPARPFSIFLSRAVAMTSKQGIHGIHHLTLSWVNMQSLQSNKSPSHAPQPGWAVPDFSTMLWTNQVPPGVGSMESMFPSWTRDLQRALKLASMTAHLLGAEKGMLRQDQNLMKTIQDIVSAREERAPAKTPPLSNTPPQHTYTPSIQAYTLSKQAYIHTLHTNLHTSIYTHAGTWCLGTPPLLKLNSSEAAVCTTLRWMLSCFTQSDSSVLDCSLEPIGPPLLFHSRRAGAARDAAALHPRENSSLFRFAFWSNLWRSWPRHRPPARKKMWFHHFLVT